MELADPLLKTPQLGVTKRSPVTSVKNEKECAVVLEKLGRGYQFAGGIRQSERGTELARTQGVLGCGDLSGRMVQKSPHLLLAVIMFVL
jgi:hypothetical protein